MGNRTKLLLVRTSKILKRKKKFTINCIYNILIYIYNKRLPNISNIYLYLKPNK